MKIAPTDQEGPSHAATCQPPVRKLSVLMPVFNEFWTLRTIVGRVLSTPLPLEIELIVVDDGSTDGSWELLQELAAADTRIKPLRHQRNCGKGVAMRTAIEHITGEVAIVQDADLEYDPRDFHLLLEPIMAGKADAVFGSRYAGAARRVSPFWHTMINKGLTLLSNIVNNLYLTDMETCYKLVRSNILKQLRLRSKSFTFEPELTCRLAQWGARIYQVPISYSSRTYLDGKKIRPRDGLLALGEILRSRFLDPQFTHHAAFYRLAASARAHRYHRWIVEQIKPFLGQRLLETGAGVGVISGMLVKRPHLVLADDQPLCTAVLEQRFGDRDNVRIDRADLAPGDFQRWEADRLDTIVCSRWSEQGRSDDALQGFFRLLEPGGHCILVLPAGTNLAASAEPIEARMAAAGFEIVAARRFDKLGGISRACAGQGGGGRPCSPRQAAWADRLVPLMRLLDGLLPSRGQALILVGRKPLRVAQRAAA